MRTEKIRLAILWTNDSKKYQLPLLGSWNVAAEGTIRLLEVEVYGSEKKKGAEDITTGEQAETPSADEELDQLLKAMEQPHFL